MQLGSNEEVLSRLSLLEAGIQQLQNDRTNGAQVLTTNAVIALRNVIAGFELMEPPNLWTQIRLAAYHLSISRPSMGSAITSALTQALAAIQEDWAKNLGNDWSQDRPDSILHRQSLKDIVIKRLDDFLQTRSQTSELLGNQFSHYLLQNFANTKQTLCILSLSFSSSLRRCLLQAFGQINGLILELRILESRPRCEGATFGLQLLHTLGTEIQMCVLNDSRKANLRVVIAPDSHVCKLAQGIDIVLLGADRISETGDMSNKMGSLAAVLCAKQLSSGVKVVVVTESDKIVKPGAMAEHIVENNDEGEVIDGWDDETRRLYCDMKSEDVLVENTYFEWVSARYIDDYVTERGVVGVGQIGVVSMEKEKLEEEIFDNKIVTMASREI
jgi:translation initiation factor 2B subunit (eIF-2B alpha/beta/delta family)